MGPSKVATAEGRPILDLEFGLAESLNLDSRAEADIARVAEEFARLARTVDPSDPWSHPDALQLDRLSFASWLDSVKVGQSTVRYYELKSRALADSGIGRTSLLSVLRKEVAVGMKVGAEIYALDKWESLWLNDGSAALVEALATDIGPGRMRLEEVVAQLRIRSPHSVEVELASAERLRAQAVICALPVPVLHGIPIHGLSDTRRSSLDAQRGVVATKIIGAVTGNPWTDRGLSGLLEGQQLVGSTWPQQADGVLSALVPPDRTFELAGASRTTQTRLASEFFARCFGDEWSKPDAVFIEEYGLDPFSRCYITDWRPGDVMRVGPLHGTHEPPIFFAGSDHWVAGYMEGAVRTGRAAAAAFLDR